VWFPFRSSLELSRRAQIILGHSNRPPGSINHACLRRTGLSTVIARPRPSFLLGEGLRARQNVQGAAPQSANPLQPSNRKTQVVTWPLPNGASGEVGLRLVTWCNAKEKMIQPHLPTQLFHTCLQYLRLHGTRSTDRPEGRQSGRFLSRSS